jgi:hypothetical protein
VSTICIYTSTRNSFLPYTPSHANRHVSIKNALKEHMNILSCGRNQETKKHKIVAITDPTKHRMHHQKHGLMAISCELKENMMIGIMVQWPVYRT